MVAKVDRDFVELRTTDEDVPTVLNDMRTIHLWHLVYLTITSSEQHCKMKLIICFIVDKQQDNTRFEMESFKGMHTVCKPKCFKDQRVGGGYL